MVRSKLTLSCKENSEALDQVRSGRAKAYIDDRKMNGGLNEDCLVSDRVGADLNFSCCIFYRLFLNLDICPL